MGKAYELRERLTRLIAECEGRFSRRQCQEVGLSAGLRDAIAEVEAAEARAGRLAEALEAYADEYKLFSDAYDDGWIPSKGLHDQLMAALTPDARAAAAEWTLNRAADVLIDDATAHDSPNLRTHTALKDGEKWEITARREGGKTADEVIRALREEVERLRRVGAAAGRYVAVLDGQEASTLAQAAKGVDEDVAVARALECSERAEDAALEALAAALAPAEPEAEEKADDR